MFPGSQHFESRKVCSSFEMGARMSDKRVIYSHKLIQTKQQVN
jgi:hypothetical protein